MITSFENDFRIELRKECLSNENIDFIMNLISEDKADANLKRMNNNAFLELRNKGLEDTFNKVCERMGVKWTHSNESSR